MLKNYLSSEKVRKPNIIVCLAAKSESDKETSDFDIFFGESTSQNIETQDSFIQKNWISLKNTSAISNTFVRNDFRNILINSSNKFEAI